jgi:outer membrane protein
MKKMTFGSAGIAAGFAFAVALAAATPVLAQGHPAPQAAAATPAPKIVVLDRQALLHASKAGQDMDRQIQALTKAASAELKGEEDALVKERSALQQQVAILAPDVKEQKIRAFEAKSNAFQQKVQQKNNQIRYGYMLAQRQLEQAVNPIVQGLMQERGANILIDRQMALIVPPGLDITAATVQRLDQKLPSVKVQLANPPPELLQQQQQQQQQAGQ